MDPQIPQYPSLRSVFLSVSLQPICQLTSEGNLETIDPLLCVSSSSIISVPHNILSGSSLDNFLVVLFECYRNECFLMSEGLLVPIPLELKLGQRVNSVR